MPQWRFIGDNQEQASLPPISLGDGSEGVWYPLLPFGSYVSPRDEYFEITPAHTAEMIAQFREGLPNATGIPVDENQAHQKNPNGAYAWITDLENREDGLWGYLKPTTEGLRNLDALPLLSPHFTVGEAVSPHYGRKNFLEAAALCSSPWFHNQPGLTLQSGATVAASMSTVGGDAPDSNANNEKGGATMPTVDELQSKIDELTTALEAKTTEATESATALETAKGEIEMLKTEAAEKDTRISELETAQTESEKQVGDLSTRLEAIEKQLNDVEAERALEAEVNKLLDEPVLDESGETVKRTREGAEVLAALNLNPCPDTVAAFNAHLQANGGKIATEALEKPALQPSRGGSHVQASVGGTAGDNRSDDQKLADLPDDDARRVRAIMESDGCGFEAARRKDYRNRH